MSNEELVGMLTLLFVAAMGVVGLGIAEVARVKSCVKVCETEGQEYLDMRRDPLICVCVEGNDLRAHRIEQ